MPGEKRKTVKDDESIKEEGVESANRAGKEKKTPRSGPSPGGLIKREGGAIGLAKR